MTRQAIVVERAIATALLFAAANASAQSAPQPVPAPAPAEPAPAAPGPVPPVRPAEETGPLPSDAPPPTAPATPAAPIVEQVETHDHAPNDPEPAPDEPPIPPPPAPHAIEERGSFAFGLGFATSLGDIREAFPWGFNIGLHGSVRIAEPFHATAGLELSRLSLRNAGTTGYVVCDGYACGNEVESGLLVSLPVGMAVHLPLGDHRLIFGAGGRYSWYSADTFQRTGIRKGPGVFTKLTFSIHGSRAVRYDLFVDGSTLFSSGERFQQRLPSDSSTDFWLNFGFALRFLL